MKPLNDDAETIHDFCNDLDRNTALGVWSRPWADCGGRSAVLQSDDISYVDMEFVRCEKEYGYSARLTALNNQCLSLLVEGLPSAGLYFIWWDQPHDQVYFSKTCDIGSRELPSNGDIGRAEVTTDFL